MALSLENPPVTPGRRLFRKTSWAEDPWSVQRTFAQPDVLQTPSPLAKRRLSGCLSDPPTPSPAKRLSRHTSEPKTPNKARHGARLADELRSPTKALDPAPVKATREATTPRKVRLSTEATRSPETARSVQKSRAPKAAKSKDEKAAAKEDDVLSSEASSDGEDATLLEGLMGEPEVEDLSGEEDVDEEAEEVVEVQAEQPQPPKAFCLVWPPKEEVLDIDDGYAADAWAKEHPELLPGFAGFNKRCTDVMNQVGVARTLHTEFIDKVACPPLQPHQESVAFLLHPKSPVTRLLIDHPTGSGKTWEIIRVLDNYFHDPRPKVPIFPKSPVCRNFYMELLRWPNRYRDYFCCVRPAHAALASGAPDWKQRRTAMWTLNHFLEEELRFLCYTIRDVLEMKDMFHMGSMRPGLRSDFAAANPGEAMPAGPMRALSYTSAGGTFVKLREQGDMPRSALMKIGYTEGCDNIYTNKVVVMDEAHNLVRTQTQYGEQLQCLRDLLVKADNLVLAGFTGTPILSKPEEGRQLLDIIKGCNAPGGDEGYLSSFPMRPEQLFPVSLPRGIPDSILTKQLQGQVVVPVELNGEALRIYDKKRRAGLPNAMLAAYCNMCTYFGSFHEGKHGSKERILSDPVDCCPKFQAIADAVAGGPEKAVVMVRKQSGYSVMLELLKAVAAESNPPFAIATIDELTEYNHVSNLRGEKFRVLVADSTQCSEGVSFLAVRRVFFADVPTSPSQLVQQCGRSIRMFGHQGLPKDEQVVVNHLYVATFPKWFQSPLSGWVFRLFRHVKDGEAETHAKKMLARLHLAGIRTLEELKVQIDAHGVKKRNSLRPNAETTIKESLTQADVVLFLELAGLWDEEKNQSLAKAKSGSQKPRLPLHVAGSTRFAALAAGSARVAELMAARTGAPPPRSSYGSTEKVQKIKKSTSSGYQLINSVRNAGRTLREANMAFGVLGQAVSIVSGVCKQIDNFVQPSLWLAELDEKLSPIRENDCVTGAMRAAANPEFKARDGDLKELTAREVKQLLHHLSRAERVMSLSSSLLALRDLFSRVEAAAEIKQKVEEEEIKEKVDEEIKKKVEEEMLALLKKEACANCLKAVVPEAYAARDAGGLKEIGLEQLRSIRDALEQQRKNDKMAHEWSPQTLAKAMRELYVSPSLDDAKATLRDVTADQQALVELADKTAEFVPALAELRSVAIDSAIFARFVEPPGCDDVEMPVADAETDNGEQKVSDGSALGSGLPDGWKLQWIGQGAAPKMAKSKAKEQHRFVDPHGQQYYGVGEYRIALEGGIQAVQAHRFKEQQARLAAAGERAPVNRAKPMGSRGSQVSGKKRTKCRW